MLRKSLSLLMLLVSIVSAYATERKYDFVVAQDGSGDFTTIQEAINAVPDFRKANRTNILIKKGNYKEKLIIPNNYQTSTLWLADRSFFKLRNLEVYYKLPASWLKKTKFMNAAKLYVRGIDLFSFDHIDENDPEAYGVNQMTKSVALGLSVTF